MRVWITKYALTQSIFEEEVELCENGTMVMVPGTEHAYTAYYHGEGRQWHRTRESAVKQAIAMRDKKIAALNRQLVKLKNTTFA